jgi:hypothetical protein
MRQCILAASVILLIVFTIASFKRGELRGSSKQQIKTSNLVSEVKTKTGVVLSSSCILIMSTNDSRLDSDTWIIRIDGTNQPQFPIQLHFQTSGAARGQELMERTGGFSIGVSLARYYGVWQVSNAQCNATLITTTKGGYVMLELLHY